jgi:hypothetical protein
MATWLYQMTTNKEDPWNPSEFRKEVWEGTPTTWPSGKVILRDEERISRGDIIVFFFAKSNNPEPGIYGWGIILEVVDSPARPRIKFQPCAPTDMMKIAVTWDEELEDVVDKIRGQMTQATMWAIKPGEFEIIKKKLATR